MTTEGSESELKFSPHLSRLPEKHCSCFSKLICRYQHLHCLHILNNFQVQNPTSKPKQKQKTQTQKNPHKNKNKTTVLRTTSLICFLVKSISFRWNFLIIVCYFHIKKKKKQKKQQQPFQTFYRIKHFSTYLNNSKKWHWMFPGQS